MPEPAKIRNVAVVGHRGTGKTSLVEALLFQTGAINRLGSVEAGTTVSDFDEDEHKRQLSIAMALEHTTWQERKVNLVDVPGDPSFQGELRCAARVVEGELVTVSARHGRRGGNVARLAPRRRARARARGLREHARPRARRLLPNARAAAVAALDELRRRAPPHRLRARSQRDRRRAAHVRVREPRGREGGRAGPDPGRDGGARRRVPREAPRRRRRDGRGAHGALSRRTGARRAGGRGSAQGRGHERRRLPGRMRDRDEEPGDARAARPPGRGRPVSREEGLADRRRRRGRRGLRLQDGRGSVRGPHQPLPGPQGHGHRRHGARQSPLEREGAHGHAPRGAGQGASSGARLRRGRPRLRREAQGRTDRRPARRQGGRHRGSGLRLPGAGDELRDHAEVEGRRGEGRLGDPAPGRGGSDPSPSSRPADGRGDSLRHEPDARRGRARAREAAVRRRHRAAPAARSLPRDDSPRGARARSLQEADRRPRPVRRLPHRRSPRRRRTSTSSSTRSSAA